MTTENQHIIRIIESDGKFLVCEILATAVTHEAAWKKFDKLLEEDLSASESRYDFSISEYLKR